MNIKLGNAFISANVGDRKEYIVTDPKGQEQGRRWLNNEEYANLKEHYAGLGFTIRQA